MPQISNFAEARAVLMRYVPGSVRESYSLDRMHKLVKLLGNPQDSYKVIHVAGTSGKTSTAYFVAAMLKHSSKKVGLTVSPHIDEVNERLQIDLNPLPEAAYCQALSEFLDIVSKTGIRPTYFELLIAFAFWEFARQKVDYAVVEVGLGGLLDGTNVINRPDKVSVITDIGLDHTHILGTTLGEIATQKAGIIGDHNMVVTYSQPFEIMGVIEDRCRQMHAQLQIVVRDDDHSQNLPGFQRHNWTLAYAVWQYLSKRDNLPPLTAAKLTSTTHTYIPGRMEIVQKKGKTIILDGAHNGQKMHALIRAIKEKYPAEKCATLLGVSVGKSEMVQEILEELLPVSNNLIITSFSVSQDVRHASVAPERIAEEAKRFKAINATVISKPGEAFAKLLNQPERLLLITGSFYLLSHIRPLIFFSIGIDPENFAANA